MIKDPNNKWLISHHQQSAQLINQQHVELIERLTEALAKDTTLAVSLSRDEAQVFLRLLEKDAPSLRNAN